MTNYVVPLEDNEKRMIVQAISDGINDAFDAFLQRPSATRNSRPFLLWDMINTNLKNITHSHRTIKPIITRVDRGTWEFVALYEKTTAHLYVVMSLDRVRDLKKHLGDRLVYHYLQQLCAVNGNGTPVPIQTSLFESILGKAETDDVVIRPEVKVSQLITDLGVEKCVTIIFDRFERQLTAVSAEILDFQFDMSYEENWEDFIPTDYSSMIQSENDQTEEFIDDESELVNLKAHHKNNNTENSIDSGHVSLKDYRKTDNAEKFTDSGEGLGLKKNEPDLNTDDN